jgi:uncharacterized protein YbbK (DUF523 family)
MLLVSACLAGFNTRWDGSNSIDERVTRLIAVGRALPVCPEQLAGLPTPRPAIEFKRGGEAVGKDGADYSEALLKGARETLRVAELYGIKEALLKDGSPSCGVSYVYSGGKRISGKGVTAALLEGKGIRVRTVDSL